MYPISLSSMSYLLLFIYDKFTRVKSFFCSIYHFLKFFCQRFQINIPPHTCTYITNQPQFFLIPLLPPTPSLLLTTQRILAYYLEVRLSPPPYQALQGISSQVIGSKKSVNSPRISTGPTVRAHSQKVSTTCLSRTFRSPSLVPQRFPSCQSRVNELQLAWVSYHCGIPHYDLDALPFSYILLPLFNLIIGVQPIPQLWVTAIASIINQI